MTMKFLSSNLVSQLFSSCQRQLVFLIKKAGLFGYKELQDNFMITYAYVSVEKCNSGWFLKHNLPDLPA